MTMDGMSLIDNNERATILRATQAEKIAEKVLLHEWKYCKIV